MILEIRPILKAWPEQVFIFYSKPEIVASPIIASESKAIPAQKQISPGKDQAGSPGTEEKPS